MPLDPARVLASQLLGERRSYGMRDTLLYALSVGFGRDTDDPGDQRFVYEGAGPAVVPTLAIPVSSLGLLARTGVDMTGVVHLSQSLAIRRPLPPAAELLVDARVVDLHDRGEGRGAIVAIETRGRDAADGADLFATTMTVLARKDGGFGGQAPAAAPRDAGATARPPDVVVPLVTRPEAALLYRLMGDWNPLHADAGFARRVGFDRPILHGLCTFGIAARALILAAADGDPARLVGMDARFSAAVYPGEEVVTELWHEEGAARFRCRVPARDMIVLDGGRATLLPIAP